MERAGITATGLGLAFIKDGLEIMNYESETHIDITRVNLESGKRFYTIPPAAVKITDVRLKDHDNSDGAYRSVPRATFEPQIEDTDGI